MTRPADLIERKRNGEELAADEIAGLVLAYARDDVPDYQMAAWCMAVYFRGLTGSETYALTDATIIVEAGALFTPLSLAAGIFMYAAAATGRPLRDAQLAAVDHLLGFEWPSFLAATNAHAVVATVLSVAYHTTGPQIPVVIGRNRDG